MDEQLKSSIDTTASEMMQQVGIKSISIDDICHRLSISKKTFYTVYSTKDELVVTILAGQEAKIESGIVRATEGKTTLQLLTEYIKISKSAKDVRQVPPMLYDLRKYYPKQYAEHLHSLHKMAERYILKHLQKGKDEGVFRSDLNVEITAVILSHMHDYVVNIMTEKREEEKRLIRTQSQYAIDVFMRGIISEEGMRQIKEYYNNK